MGSFFCLKKENMFHVYIIYSKHLDAYYKGYTNHIELRLIEHCNGKSKYTSQSNDWELVYSKTFETKREALIEERRIKKLNRASIEKLLKRLE
jgi:putative endonuclease